MDKRHTITIFALLLTLSLIGQDSPYFMYKKCYDGQRYYYPDSMLQVIDSERSYGQIDKSLNYKPGQLQAITKLDSTTVTVYLINATNETLPVDVQDGSIPTIREALNENGVWQPIEYWGRSWCGNSYYQKNLSPQEQYSVQTFLYGGPYKTKIRFKFLVNKSVVYSDSYNGQINKKQFKKPTDLKLKSFLDPKNKR